MELNDEGKIHLEETLNESAINGDSDATRNVSDSTFDETKDTSLEHNQHSDTSDATAPTVTAAVLSIDDRENGEIFKNNLINNNINNNKNNNNNNHMPSALPFSVQCADDKSSQPAQADSDELTTTPPLSSNDDDTATAKTECDNDASGAVVNNDSDNKRLLNHINNDAVNSVGSIAFVIFISRIPAFSH